MKEIELFIQKSTDEKYIVESAPELKAPTDKMYCCENIEDVLSKIRQILNSWDEGES